MAEVTISDELYARLVAFKPMVEAVLETNLDFDGYVGLLLRTAPDYILAEIFAGADAGALFQLLQRVGQEHPEVYGAIADTLMRDELTIEARRRAVVKRRMGFPEPEA